RFCPKLPIAFWPGQPLVETAAADLEHNGHLLNWKYIHMVLNEDIFAQSPLEKMATAFFNIAFSSSASFSRFLNSLTSCSSGLILSFFGSMVPPLNRGSIRHLLNLLGSRSSSLAACETEPFEYDNSTAIFLNDS